MDLTALSTLDLLALSGKVARDIDDLRENYRFSLSSLQRDLQKIRRAIDGRPPVQFPTPPAAETDQPAPEPPAAELSDQPQSEPPAAEPPIE